MGLFDRLFGKKEETEKVLPSSEEVTESNELVETVKEEPAATQNDKEEQKIADMEAYYQELKARIAATHQPVSTVTQDEASEEGLVEEIVTSEPREDQEVVEASPVVSEPVQTEELFEEATPIAGNVEPEHSKVPEPAEVEMESVESDEVATEESEGSEFVEEKLEREETGEVSEEKSELVDTFEPAEVKLDDSEVREAEGDLPEEMEEFFEEIGQKDYSGKVYGVIGTGDTIYEQYCVCVDQFNDQIAKTGATNPTENLKIEIEADTDEDFENIDKFIEAFSSAL